MWWQYVLTVLLGLLGVGAVWGVTALFAIKMPYDGGGVKYLILGLLSILATGIVVAFGLYWAVKALGLGF